ncbi:MAG: hypothetical protein DRI24_20995 [Deltaproteobacteria bacterium]|nr:MAG: hypothetical protein DRI24_20995 [Deltaproteobacteria bacterium]
MIFPPQQQQDPNYAQQINRKNRLQEEKDEQDFFDANNTLSRAMGRPELFPGGLTDGAASRNPTRRPIPTNVPAGAMQQPENPMGKTYWENNARDLEGKVQPNNRVELAGMMNRGVQQFVKSRNADEREAAKQLFLKGYNDGPWSSVTDATDMIIDDNGVVLIGADGKAINKAVPMEEFQNIMGNALTGQNVYQQSSGNGGEGAGLQQPQSKSAVKAAEVVGAGKIDKWKAELKALRERASLGDTDPKLQNRITEVEGNLDQALTDAGSDIHDAGLPGSGGTGLQSVEQSLLNLMDTKSANSDAQIRQRMLDRYGRGAMNATEQAINRRTSDNNKAGLKKPSAPATTPAPTKEEVLKQAGDKAKKESGIIDRKFREHESDVKFSKELDKLELKFMNGKLTDSDIKEMMEGASRPQQRKLATLRNRMLKLKDVSKNAERYNKRYNKSKLRDR